MGYRSDVAGIIKFNSVEDREKFILMVQARNDGLYKNCFENPFHNWQYEGALHYVRDPIITFKADDVKWYESYEEVQLHYELCKYATETFEAGWRMVQVGEDGATEEEGEDNDFDLDQYIYARTILNTEF